MKNLGRYEILEEIGRGATGVVYKASDPTIGRTVALKVLSLTSAAAGIPGARETFMREARAAGKLSHPGIVAIHDALEDPETQSSCIVMEYAPGPTLDQILSAESRLEPTRALQIARQVAEALDYAHRHNVIHRDLKPANVLIADDGQAKLTDFGIAKLVAQEGALRTVSIMGTPAYMSPEQVSGGEVDARSDIFSLGILLYMMLTGDKPFRGETAVVMFKIAYEDPAPPSELEPKLNKAHDYIVLRCLAKNRDKRYSSALEFLDDLDDVEQGRSPRSEARVPLSEIRVGELTVATPGEGAISPSRRHAAGKRAAWLGAGIGAGIGLVAALFGILAFHDRRPPVGAVAAPPVTSAASVPLATAPPPPVPASTHPASKPDSPLLGKPTATSKKRVITEVTTKPSMSKSSARTARTTTLTSVRPKTASASRRPPQPSAAASSPSRTALPGTSGTVIQLVCKHDLVNATLVISSPNQILSQWPLKARKKGGFLGIKRGRSGTLSRSLTIPPGTRELSVRVVSGDGSLDLSRPISAIPPAGKPPTLQVEIAGDRLTVNWQLSPQPKS